MDLQQTDVRRTGLYLPRIKTRFKTWILEQLGIVSTALEDSCEYEIGWEFSTMDKPKKLHRI